MRTDEVIQQHLDALAAAIDGLPGIDDLVADTAPLRVEIDGVLAAIQRRRHAIEAARQQQTRVALGVDANGVVARTPEAEPVARSLRTVMDAMAKQPLGSMAQQVFEVAVHIEALEMENAALRQRCAEYERELGIVEP